MVLILMMTALVTSGIMLGWALFSSRIHLAILMTVGIVVEAVFLYRLWTGSMREVLFFFRALENDDTSIKYSSSQRSQLINELHQHLSRVNANFQKIRLNNEKRELYFSRILEHLSSGLILISESGHINHINEQALRLLNLQQLTHIKAFSRSYPGLYPRIKGMKTLERAELTLTDGETGLRRIIGFQVVDLRLGGENVRVLTLNDLSAGMERKEIDDWIRLIRVLSHEIMNSLAPITSISTTLKEVWADHVSVSGDGAMADRRIQQTLKGLDAIAEQSEGLTTFFESYRVLSRIPEPVKKDFLVTSLFEKLETLVSHYKEGSKLKILFDCKDPALILLADEQMITQVMLNLVKNAVQAVDAVEMPVISISALSKDNRLVLEVTDNGEGIPPELSDEIFMPFFTTRRKGTGVGLSYSRQVMVLNGGRIEYDSQPGRTRFRLLF